MVVGELMVGVVSGGVSATDVPSDDSETDALRAELNGGAGAGANSGKGDAARVIVLMCHETHRTGVFELLEKLGRPTGGRRVGAHDAGPPPAGSTQAGLIRACLAAHHRGLSGRLADDGSEEQSMETAIGIVLILVSLALIIGIVRVVQANMPGR